MTPILYIPQNTSQLQQEILTQMTAPFGVVSVFRQPETNFFLQFDGNKITLKRSNDNVEIYSDFTNHNLQKRTQQNNHELIVKAVNLKENKYIWDATAGLGKDAFVLASFGAKVHLFERNPIVATLLSDGLRRARADIKTQTIAEKMQLTFGSINLATDIESPQAIYIDTMFPERKKNALVKKEMQFFQEIIREENDDKDLLLTARKFPVNRIVVKRPIKAEYLGNIKPAYQYTGKNIRFDVYLSKT